MVHQSIEHRMLSISTTAKRCTHVKARSMADRHPTANQLRWFQSGMRSAYHSFPLGNLVPPFQLRLFAQAHHPLFGQGVRPTFPNSSSRRTDKLEILPLIRLGHSFSDSFQQSRPGESASLKHISVLGEYQSSMFSFGIEWNLCTTVFDRVA